MPALKKSARKKRNAYTRSTVSGGKKERSRPPLRLPGKLAGWLGRSHWAGLKSFAAVLLAVCLAGGGVAGLCGASIWLYNKAVTSPFFSIRQVDISGNVRLTREMVLQYGGIQEGANSLALSIAGVERNLRQTPWVAEVSVKRLLPDRIAIRLKERLPSFWVHKDGILQYANERGETIAPVESRNFLSLPTLSVEAGAEDAIPYLAYLLRDLRRGVLPVDAGALASVRLAPGRGVEIYLEDRALRLSIATGSWEGNMARLGVCLGDLARRQELRHVRELRAVEGNVWVVYSQHIEG